MGSVSKASVDCLPDDILSQILSLLPTKQAVSTSVLSKRWRTLFNFNLEIDKTIFCHPNRNKRKNFRNFMDRTLALRGCNHVKKLSLKFRVEYEDKHDIDHWLWNALEHGVSELHLAISSMWRFVIPSKLFTSTTLVKLSLGRQFFISLPSDTSLPALKVLFLDSVCFKDNQFSNVFLPACPALEDLTINNPAFPPNPYVISSKTIKRLSVTNYLGCYGDCDIISLNTPSAVDLHYSDLVRHRYPHCNLDSLAKATLDLHLAKEANGSNDGGVADLLSGIRYIKTLHLTCSSVKVISVCCKKQLPVFNNLVDLVFLNKKTGWEVLLPLMLEHSPNLKTLVLSGMDLYEYRQHRSMGFCIQPNNQVKMLSIMEYQGSDHELEHISHFLLKMECLEVVRVYVSPAMDDPKKTQLTEDLLKLPTASSELKIQVM